MSLSMRLVFRPTKAYGCVPADVPKYQKRISEPMLDRIDIHFEVPGADYEKLKGMEWGDFRIRARMQAARDI